MLEHPDHGTAYLRDQHPLSIKMLERALTDMTVSDWLEQLNQHVFFSPTVKRLESLYDAYSNQPRLVLSVDTGATGNAPLSGSLVSDQHRGGRTREARARK
jgi:hypothetical protein